MPSALPEVSSGRAASAQPSSPCPPGALECPCHDGGACDDPLVCDDGVCVTPGSSTSEDATTTLATTEPSTSGSTSDTSSTTGPPYEGPYGHCTDDADCVAPDVFCLPQSFTTCGATCVDDTDCPEPPPGGTAQPEEAATGDRAGGPGPRFRCVIRQISITVLLNDQRV